MEVYVLSHVSFGTDIIHKIFPIYRLNMKILCGILSVPQDNVMDLNNTPLLGQLNNIVVWWESYTLLGKLGNQHELDVKLASPTCLMISCHPSYKLLMTNARWQIVIFTSNILDINGNMDKDIKFITRSCDNCQWQCVICSVDELIHLFKYALRIQLRNHNTFACKRMYKNRI